MLTEQVRAVPAALAEKARQVWFPHQAELTLRDDGGVDVLLPVEAGQREHQLDAEGCAVCHAHCRYLARTNR